MPWTPPSDPVTSTVITVAYAIANLLTQIRWLRLMTGNADPPGSGYVLTSDSVAAVTWKQLGAAIVGGQGLGYTPVNKAGDTITGTLGVNGTTTLQSFVAIGGDTTLTRGFVGAPSQGILYLGSTAGKVYVSGTGTDLQLGGDLVDVVPLLQARGGIRTFADIQLYRSSALSTGFLLFGSPPLHTLGFDGTQFVADNSRIWRQADFTLGTGTNQVPTNNGILNPNLVAGFATASTNAVNATNATTATSATTATTATNATQLGGRAPGGLAGQVPYNGGAGFLCQQLNADMTDGAHASATPTAGTIPIADAAGKLDAWISPSGLAGVPTGIAVLWSGPNGNDGSAGNIPSGWGRFSALDGRVPVGAGTTASVTWTANTATGSSWSHAHSTPAHAHSGAPLTISGTTGAASGSGNQANIVTPNPTSATQSHTHDQGNLDVAGNTATDGSGTSGAPAWDFPAYAAIWIRKS